jgi:hypothetical protein
MKLTLRSSFTARLIPGVRLQNKGAYRCMHSASFPFSSLCLHLSLTVILIMVPSPYDPP